MSIGLEKGNMDGLMNLESYMNSTSQERRKKTMDVKSPWSSGSGPTSPLPQRLSLFDKSYSGGSTNSLGSSPGAEIKTLTGQASLTVPDLNLPPNKVSRSTSPFHFRSRKSDKKRLEKQSNCLDEPTNGPLSALPRYLDYLSGTCNVFGQAVYNSVIKSSIILFTKEERSYDVQNPKCSRLLLSGENFLDTVFGIMFAISAFPFRD